MLRRAKKINPDAKVIVTGCYAQTNSREILEIEDVDFVIDNKNKSNIVNFVGAIEDISFEREKMETFFKRKSIRNMNLLLLER